jgi:hypothetical protein
LSILLDLEEKTSRVPTDQHRYEDCVQTSSFEKIRGVLLILGPEFESTHITHFHLPSYHPSPPLLSLLRRVLMPLPTRRYRIRSIEETCELQTDCDWAARSGATNRASAFLFSTNQNKNCNAPAF